jgi:hypothetical protein
MTRVPHMDSQDPSAWGWPRGAAARIVPFSYRGHAFPSGVASGTQAVFTAALDRICAQPGFQLPTSTGLDAGCWGYSDRKKASGSGWSFHAYGLALDVAAPWNPMGRNKPRPSVHRLPENTHDLISPLGLVWGGTFGDWMHIECHLSPGELASSGGGSGRPAPSSRPLLRQGSAGADVRALQSALNGFLAARGLPPLGVDGMFGPQTRRAVLAFQAAHGLVADGLVGPRTWGALSL